MLLTKIILVLTGLLGGVSAALLGGAMMAGRTWLQGDEIAYVSYRELNPDIYIIDLVHDLSYNMTKNPAYDVAPAWSPDGAWLAFASDRDGRRNIYIMDRTGRSVRRLTFGGGIYTAPRWSEDGQRLIFIALDESPNGIYSIDLDGRNFRNLLAASETSTAFALDLAIETSNISRARSPDGSRIAFMTFRNEDWGIYISRDTTRRDARLLVNVGYPSEPPVWSPDGKFMAFIAQLNGTVDLYIVGVDDGTQPRRLTSNRTYEAAPSWRPS